MSRIDAINEYRLAQKAGIKYYNACVAAHKNPYPEVLEDQINETQASGHALIGTIEIPSEYIVGTLAAGRKTAFAGNFRPILPENSEFATKWVSLCEAHLSEDGIRDSSRSRSHILPCAEPSPRWKPPCGSRLIVG